MSQHEIGYNTRKYIQRNYTKYNILELSLRTAESPEAIMNFLGTIEAKAYLPVIKKYVNYFILPGVKLQTPLTEEIIIGVVCKYFNIPAETISTPKRTSLNVRVRQMIMYIIRKELKRPYIVIGKLFGGRDHTTAIHNVQKAAIYLEIDEQFKTEYFCIMHLLFKHKKS